MEHDAFNNKIPYQTVSHNVGRINANEALFIHSQLRDTFMLAQHLTPNDFFGTK